jgi:uncharacterized membrane protein (UPF0127 family)
MRASRVSGFTPALLALCIFFSSRALADETRLPVTRVHAPRAELVLEIAKTPAQREHGLMGRASLAPHHGMIFVFEHTETQYFWMKDTLVPLDMVFVRGDGVVTWVAGHVPARTKGMTDDQLPRRQGLARYVIELPADESERDGIRTGLKLHVSLFPSGDI